LGQPSARIKRANRRGLRQVIEPVLEGAPALGATGLPLCARSRDQHSGHASMRVANAAGPMSVFVADAHGELVAAATMDDAPPDTRLDAQRKAYTAARSDPTSTRQLAEKARADPVERVSFDPFFTFFGGVAVFEDGRRVGAVGVSGPAWRRRRAARAGRRSTARRPSDRDRRRLATTRLATER
jgi:uncharacterized protein GlcG (DUF336 family)